MTRLLAHVANLRLSIIPYAAKITEDVQLKGMSSRRINFSTGDPLKMVVPVWYERSMARTSPKSEKTVLTTEFGTSTGQ